MLTTHPFDDDKLREECGVFGIWGAETASAVVALGLHALQHRGQEAAGVSSWDGHQFHTHRAMGHVAGNFDRDDIIRALPGTVGIGHVRYSTTGETILRNVQPLFCELDGGGFAQFDSPTLAGYEATVGAEVVTKLGCANAADIPACLRALPSATIVKKTLGPGGLFVDAYYRPNIDGVLLNDNALQTAKEGAHNHVPLIIGGDNRETANPGTFIPLPPDPNSIPTDAAYQTVIHDRFGQTVGDQILALYPSAAYPTPRDALIGVSTDYRFLCPARQLARAVSNSQREPVYRFVFTHAQSAPQVANAQGAWHGEAGIDLWDEAAA